MTMLNEMLRTVLSWVKDKRGQTTIEYLLVLVLIVLVIVLAFQTAAVEEAISVGVSIIANAIENP